MADQLLDVYDTAVLAWLNSNFGSLIVGKTLNVSVGTPDRAFAEYVTPIGDNPEGRTRLPRAALTIEDFVIDHARYNPAPVRLLGYSDATKLSIRRANYPTPVNFPYTINFWTEYKREMNLLVQKLMVLFTSGRTTITVDVDEVDADAVYGEKMLHLVKESEINSTGDLEPGTEERELRRTMSFYLEGWLWDIDYTDRSIVKQVELEVYDLDSEVEFETVRTPRTQNLWEGDGATTDFGPTAVLFLPILERTLIVDFIVGGTSYRVHDDGLGDISGDGIDSGTVNYVTGEITISFTSPPDDETDITVAYYTTLA